MCTNYAEQSSWFNGGVGGRLFYTFTQWGHKCFTYCYSELFCSASKISEWFIFHKPSQTLIKAFKCFQFEINSLSKYSEIARGTSFSLFHCHVLVVSIFHVKLESRLNLNGESKLLLIIKMRAISSVKKTKTWFRHAEIFFCRCPSICPSFGNLQKYMLLWGTILCTAFPLHYAIHRDLILLIHVLTSISRYPAL